MREIVVTLEVTLTPKTTQRFISEAAVNNLVVALTRSALERDDFFRNCGIKVRVVDQSQPAVVGQTFGMTEVGVPGIVGRGN